MSSRCPTRCATPSAASWTSFWAESDRTCHPALALASVGIPRRRRYLSCMPDGPDHNLPAKIDRAAVDRVLARAAQLQAEGTTDTQEQLTEAQLLDLAKEVGLDPVNLRQALAEERTRVAVPDER